MNAFRFASRRYSALAASILFLSISSALAEPNVNSADGDLTEKGKLILGGSHFGDKPHARPLVFADFNKDLNPSAGGERKEWDRIENMEWAKEGPDGSGCARGVAGAGSWTFLVKRDAWSRDGEKAYVFRRQRMNFSVTDKSQNWKIWRMWPENGSTPNIYAAAHNGRIFVENVGGESGFWGRLNVPELDWANEEIMFQASSLNVKNGVFWFRSNGVDLARGSVMTRSSKAMDYMTKNFAVHGVAANPRRWSPPWIMSNRIWVDEVYVDTVWSRVMLGDKPLRKEGRLWEIEIPVKWTDTSIELEAHPGIFKPGQTAYLFVFDAEGKSNEVGFPVRIGENHTLVARAAAKN